MFIITIIIFIPITQQPEQDRWAENQSMSGLSSLNGYEYLWVWESVWRLNEKTELTYIIFWPNMLTKVVGRHFRPHPSVCWSNFVFYYNFTLLNCFKSKRWRQLLKCVCHTKKCVKCFYWFKCIVNHKSPFLKEKLFKIQNSEGEVVWYCPFLPTFFYLISGSKNFVSHKNLWNMWSLFPTVILLKPRNF